LRLLRLTGAARGNLRTGVVAVRLLHLPSAAWLCSTRLSTAGLLPGLHIVSVGTLLRPGLCGLLRLRVLLLCLVRLVRLRLPERAEVTV